MNGLNVTFMTVSPSFAALLLALTSSETIFAGYGKPYIQERVTLAHPPRVNRVHHRGLVLYRQEVICQCLNPFHLALCPPDINKLPLFLLP